MLALTALLVLLWCKTHHYQGLGGDARLYAVQALARIRANLLHDLYLRYTSQDSYTIFSCVYAEWIGLLGLRDAALTLTILFKVWLFTAAWVIARKLSDGYCAFLAVALLIVTTGEYGGFGVFHYAEDWLTARSLAEALVMTSLAFWYWGSPFIGLLIASGAMFVHPLLALPGLLLLICLGLPLRLGALGAAAGVLLALVISLMALWHPFITHLLVVMDENWLEVVRERSQFLFLQLWRGRDWEVNAQPFLSLCISWLAIADARVRKLCAAALLVGAAGLAVGLIASLIGPVPLLLQGQAWRWVWVTSSVAVLLLVPTFLALWRSGKGGPLCSVLMISAWTFPALLATGCLAGALILWLLRERVDFRAAGILTVAATLFGLCLLVSGVIFSWRSAWPGLSGSVAEPSTVIDKSPGLSCLYITLVGSIAYWIRANRTVTGSVALLGVLSTATWYYLPQALRERDLEGSPAEISRFTDWRRAIAPDANVFVAPARNSAAFAWFTLERPSYLTVDQSSGVVFSRQTALEVRRRSQVLLPLMDPDWKILSSMNAANRDKNHQGKPASMRPLTIRRLSSICTDPDLNFVVSSENIGLEPLRSSRPGDRQEWYLYDCRLVHGLTSSGKVEQ